MLGGKYRRGAYERSANKGNDVLRKLHTGHKNGCEKRHNGGVPPYRSAFLHKITAVYRYAGYLYQTTAGRFAESHEEKSAEQQEPLLEIKRPPLYEKVRCLIAIFPTLTHQAVCGSRERQSSIMI